MPNLLPQSPEDLTFRLGVLLAAFALDWLIGEPDILWRRCPHPVVLFGRAVTLFDRRWNDRAKTNGQTRRVRGIYTIGILVTLAGILGYFLSAIGWAVDLTIVTILLAGRSLDDHIRAVSLALDDNIDAARTAVAMIVGRSTSNLNENEIAKAAIETGAENLSDGVIAPAIWFLILGLPGILIYKMTNTADSMIGYKNAKFLAFGYGAARFDDLLNYLPARITAFLIMLASCNRAGGVGRAARVMFKDADTHASPNAGWPEAAMAGGLNVQLAGPRSYGKRIRHADHLNKDGNTAEREHITRSLHVLKGAQLLFAATLCLFLI